MSSIFVVMWASNDPVTLGDKIPSCFGVFYEYEDALKCVLESHNEAAEWLDDRIEPMNMETLKETACLLGGDAWNFDTGIWAINRSDFYA